MKIINLKEKGRLILPSSLIYQLDWLHKKIGSIEFSGMLFYTMKGQLEDPESIECRAERFFLCDIGTATFTEFNDVDHIPDLLDTFNDIDKYRRGTLHTHHGMRAFFSGTDTQELEDNTKFFDAYLSLIINFDGNYCAKIAYVAEQEFTSSFRFRNLKNKFKNFRGEKVKEEVLITIDLDIIKSDEESITKQFVDRYEQIKKSCTKAVGFQYKEYQGKANSDKKNSKMSLKELSTEYLAYKLDYTDTTNILKMSILNQKEIPSSDPSNYFNNILDKKEEYCRDNKSKLLPLLVDQQVENTMKRLTASYINYKKLKGINNPLLTINVKIALYHSLAYTVQQAHINFKMDEGFTKELFLALKDKFEDLLDEANLDKKNYENWGVSI